MVKLSHIINNIDFQDIIGKIDLDIRLICYDSRKVSNDSLFVAIKGEKFDSHSLIPEVINNGAVAVICQDLPENYHDYNCTFILVANSRAALAQSANAFYDFPSRKLDLYGVTGTNGKTTTTFILESIFQEHNKENQNNSGIGVIGTTGIFYNSTKIEATHTTPESLDLTAILDEFVRNGVTTAFMEVSSHSLAMYRCYGLDFKGAIFTNLSHDHLDFHNDMDDYANAKKKLFDWLPQKSVAVINTDDQYGSYMVKNTLADIVFVTFNDNQNAKYSIKNIQLGLDKTLYSICTANHQIEIETKLIGKFNIENTALCAILALESGVKQETIQNALKNSLGAPGRMERYTLKDNSVAIIDYAHTPDAIEKALITCKELLETNAGKGKLIVVFGCGGDRDKTKRPVMGGIASRIADITIITNDNPRTEDAEIIANEVASGIQNNAEFKIILDRQTAIENAVELASQGSIILIAGKGHEEYQIIQTTKIPFSDKQEVQKYI